MRSRGESLLKRALEHTTPRTVLRIIPNNSSEVSSGRFRVYAQLYPETRFNRLGLRRYVPVVVRSSKQAQLASRTFGLQSIDPSNRRRGMAQTFIGQRGGFFVTVFIPYPSRHRQSMAATQPSQLLRGRADETGLTKPRRTASDERFEPFLVSGSKNRLTATKCADASCAFSKSERQQDITVRSPRRLNRVQGIAARSSETSRNYFA